MAAIDTGDDLAYVRDGISADLDTMLIFNLLRTQSYLAPFLDSDLREQNLSGAQFNALLVLRAAGSDGLLMGEIGERLVVTKSNVTGLIDRLERQGLAIRAPHADRRAILVRLTPAGEQLLDHTAPRMARLHAELAAVFHTTEKRTLIELLTKLRRALRQRRKEAL